MANNEQDRDDQREILFRIEALLEAVVKELKQIRGILAKLRDGDPE